MKNLEKKLSKKISRICIGTWGLGSSTSKVPSYGLITKKKSKKILNFSFKNKINFFDTAGIYGDGKSEQILGETFYKHRDRVVFATKIGCYNFDKKLDFSVDRSKKLINESLERLSTNYLDIVQFHSPSELDLKKNIKQTLIFLKELKKEKKIRAIGVSLSSPLHLKYIDHKDFDLIQANFNLMDLRLLKVLSKKFRSKIMIRTALNFGTLTEKFAKSKISFSKLDHRSRWNLSQLELWQNRANDYKKLFKKNGNELSLQQNALRFCFNYFNFVNIGVMDIKELREYLTPAIFRPFSKKTLVEISRFYNKNDFFIAKLKPKIKIKK